MVAEREPPTSCAETLEATGLIGRSLHRPSTIEIDPAGISNSSIAGWHCWNGWVGGMAGRKKGMGSRAACWLE